MKKEISLEERRNIQLEMLSEIDFFCKQKGIRYSLSYGTLIGAIRHRGFIPWDDDVDLMMPLPDMLRFKKEFKSEKIKFCDVDTESHYEFPFPRIAHKATYSIRGIACKSYGINIDLYTIISLPNKGKDYDSFFSTAKELYEHRMNFLKWKSRIVNRIPVSTIPGFDKSIREYRNFLFDNCPLYGSTDLFFVISSPLIDKEIEMCSYSFDLFEKDMVNVPFENLNLSVTPRYHDFLTQYYGDYMELPPEEERHPYHGGRYYWL